MSEQSKSGPYGKGLKLIFACSGAADVGAITDSAARRLGAEGAGKMSCIAGIGGRVADVMAAASSASKILAIDGCNLDCVKLTLMQAGFGKFEYVRLTDHGMEKGQSPVTEDRVKAVAEIGRSLLVDT